MKPLRILMTIHTLWRRTLGAPRVQMELGEELAKLGDHVEKFSYDDAFPAPRRLARYFPPRFSRKSVNFVRKNGRRFDVIDANQIDLPVSKHSLGFDGLLVARSVGLMPVYREFDRYSRTRWPVNKTWKRLAWKLLETATNTAAKTERDALRSFQHADLINLSNSDELEWIRKSTSWGPKAVSFPFGLSTERWECFRAADGGIRRRIASKTVGFIGTWTERKGSRDWPLIVASVLSAIPQARFLFLGTSHTVDFVLKEFSAGSRARCQVIPSYESNELPALLSDVTVAGFPAYLEGFPSAVLEKLAAGLPTVAYDAPGAREMLRHLERPTMVKRGDWQAFAQLLITLLQSTGPAYEVFSADATAVAARFRWRDIALATRECYVEHLNRVAVARRCPYLSLGHAG